jgi:hypothetical protein
VKWTAYFAVDDLSLTQRALAVCARISDQVIGVLDATDRQGFIARRLDGANATRGDLLRPAQVVVLARHSPTSHTGISILDPERQSESRNLDMSVIA